MRLQQCVIRDALVSFCQADDRVNLWAAATAPATAITTQWRSYYAVSRLQWILWTDGRPGFTNQQRLSANTHTWLSVDAQRNTSYDLVILVLR